MGDSHEMMVAIAEQVAPQLDLEDKRRLVGILEAAIARELAGAAEDQGGAPPKCPRCGCEQVTRKGTWEGRQRWRCKGCGRTFTARTLGLLAQSKLPETTWMEFAEAFVDRLTLRDCADKCGVSLKTAWFMRHRMCEVVERMLPAFETGAGCEVEVDEKFVRGSYTGNHRRNVEGFPSPAARGGAGATGSGAARATTSCAS